MKTLKRFLVRGFIVLVTIIAVLSVVVKCTSNSNKRETVSLRNELSSLNKQIDISKANTHKSTTTTQTTKALIYIPIEFVEETEPTTTEVHTTTKKETTSMSTTRNTTTTSTTTTSTTVQTEPSTEITTEEEVTSDEEMSDLW